MGHRHKDGDFESFPGKSVLVEISPDQGNTWDHGEL